MTQVEVSLSDQTDSEITRLVEQGEFINRDQAIEKILTRGISAYDTNEEPESEISDDVFNSVTNDQQDPALQDDPHRDESTF